MIFKIAFQNIWRNKLRSWVVILAIALGIFGGLAVISTATGLTKMRQENAIKTYVSHIQVHDSAYLTYGRLQDTISSEKKIMQFLSLHKEVAAVSNRLKVESFIQSAGGNSGVILNGIDTKREKELTNLSELCEKGNFLEVYKRKPPIIISQKLATKLNAKIKTSIQCSFTNMYGEATTGVFKVVDIFSSSNSMYDELNAFVRLEDLQSLSLIDGSHEIAFLLKDDKKVEEFREVLLAKYPNQHIASWRGIAPELGYADKMMDLVMTIFLVIIMLALAFGIVNTMLMAVLERKKELGMLISIGMNKRKVFWMIVLESIFLALIAGPLGIFVTYIAVQFFGNYGIDLSFAAAGLKSVGLESTIFPDLNPMYYVIISLLVIVTAILSCIYPALKALKLNPAETLRTA
ncbi:FtsX-like permease family protein [Bacteroidia bacterium]|nr:FtsX-like permease family protein [Bacteroidia bacterium]MDB4107471.1 FtsX-like permease family protein [Bacteroidia bacterium]MDB9881644.1 FtsX-like permease family protein [Bacteroidia bacterium]